MLYLAADKHGYQAIALVERYLKARGIEFENLGVQNENEDMKLEDMIPKVVNKVLAEKTQGILSCGTGVGVAVGANKFSGIRACLATDEKIAEYARVFDDCNVLCLVGWSANEEKINKILDAWFSNKYDGDANRLKMFEEFNKWH